MTLACRVQALALVLCFTPLASAQASRPQDDLREAEARHREAKRAWNDAHAPRRGVRGRGKEWSEWSAEECKQFCDLIVQDKLLNAWRDYGLSPEQRERVKAYLEDVKVRQLQFFREAAPKVAPATQRALELRLRGKGLSPHEAEELRGAYADMRSAWAAGPLSRRQEIETAIEGMLPPEQAAKRRQRAAASRPSFVEYLCVHLRMKMRLPAGDRATLVDLQQCESCEDWELYLAVFTKCYTLDAPQSESAQSALREAIAARDEYLRQGLPELVPDAFALLKSRLEAIPTADQRKAAMQLSSQQIPASRPASAPAQ